MTQYESLYKALRQMQRGVLKMFFAGLDIGTSGCKCVIADEKGNEVSSSYRAYATNREKGRQEIYPDDLKKSVFHVIKEAVATSGCKDISALSLTSFGESCVMLDKDGKTLSPIILYTDSRGTKECDELKNDLGDRQIFDITGHHCHIMFLLPKLIWMKRNQPEIYAQISHILPITSFVIYSLTGRFICDYSLSSRLLMFDIHKKEWSDEMLSYAEIDRSLLPETVPTGTVTGVIAPHIANELGLGKNVKVVAGPQDQIACAIGTGCVNSEYVVNGSGTVDCYTPMYPSDKYPGDKKIFFDGGFPILPSFDNYLTSFAFVMNSGSLREWYLKTFMPYLSARAKRKGVKIWDLAEDFIKDDPTGMMVVPHFTGSATPYMDPLSKSIIIGLNFETGPEELFTALVEGITYDGYKNLQILRECGIEINKLRATGGGSRSPKWLQLKADLFGIEVGTVKSKESGALGTIMLSCVASGIYKDLKEAMSEMVKPGTIYYPNKSRGDKYREIYEKQSKLYECFKTLE